MDLKEPTKTGNELRCSECERLLGRHREATKVWAEANKELVESARTHEAEIFSSALGKRQMACELSHAAAQELREHIQAAHEGNSLERNLGGVPPKLFLHRFH